MILFVCSGNTCRSPLAEVIASALGISAMSAGLYASPGMAASKGAVNEAEMRGLSLRGYRSRQVTPELLEEAATVFAMSDDLADAMVQSFPEYKAKITAISPNIPDPWRGDDYAYSLTAALLEEFILSLLPKR